MSIIKAAKAQGRNIFPATRSSLRWASSRFFDADGIDAHMAMPNQSVPHMVAKPITNGAICAVVISLPFGFRRGGDR
jgi:hypothetical protein